MTSFIAVLLVFLLNHLYGTYYSRHPYAVSLYVKPFRYKRTSANCSTILKSLDLNDEYSVMSRPTSTRTWAVTEFKICFIWYFGVSGQTFQRRYTFNLIWSFETCRLQELLSDWWCALFWRQLCENDVYLRHVKIRWVLSMFYRSKNKSRRHPHHLSHSLRNFDVTYFKASV